MQKGKSRGAYPGLAKRPENGIFQFKLDLPKDVREHFERRFVVVSLGTEDRRVAIEKWAPLHAEWRGKIRAARSGTLRNIDDRFAWEIAFDLLEGDRGHDYLRPHQTLTLAAIADMVAADLTRHSGFIDDEKGFLFPTDRLTGADRAAIVAAVQEQVFRRLTKESNDNQTQAGKLAERARAIKPADAAAAGAIRLMDTFQDWKKETNPRPKSISEFEKACLEFIGVVGDLPLKDFDKHSFVKFKKHLLAAKKADGSPISQSTRVKRFGAVKAVIAVAVANLDIDNHPGDKVVMGKAPKSKLRTDGLMDNEIEALFEGPVHTEGERPRGGGGEASYWLPIIALHSGARLSEMAQLNVKDIVTQDGVRCFRVMNDSDEGQSIKNEVSHRLIPIHKRIIELGFFEYVDTLDPNGRLFPLVRPDSHGVAGGLFSKWYGGYRHGVGITRKGADFHAMRHHVKTMLRAIPGDDEIKLSITGHSNGNTSEDYGRISAKETKKIIDQISYDVTIPKWKATKVRKAA